MFPLSPVDYIRTHCPLLEKKMDEIWEEIRHMEIFPGAKRLCDHIGCSHPKGTDLVTASLDKMEEFLRDGQ